MTKAEVKELARQLINKHLPNSVWRFQFDRAKRRAGCCKYGKKLITLSEPLLPKMSDNEIRDTLLHEIAHALTPGEQHSPEWKRVALSIGCNGERCHTLDTSGDAKYKAECLNCQTKFHRYRRPKHGLSAYRCGKCNTRIIFKEQK